MAKENLERQVHTWMMKKVKKNAIVYKTKKKEEKRDEKNQISKACPKRLFAKNYAHRFSFFTLKSNILAQDSD